MTYTTIQGQTWDMIAREIYGKENYAGLLMENNHKKLDHFIFPSGITIKVPDLTEDTEDMPPWRSEDGES